MGRGKAQKTLDLVVVAVKILAESRVGGESRTRPAPGAGRGGLAALDTWLQDEHGDTGSDERSSACDEQVFHTHLLRADAVSPLRLSGSGMSRAMAPGSRAVRDDTLVDKIAHRGSECPTPAGSDAEERGRVIWVEGLDGVANPRE